MVAEPGIHRIEVTTLGDLLDLRAAELGEHLAMVFPDHRVTYAGLAERADFFARGLLAAGLKPGETVGIHLPNCVDAIATLFGAAKAGLYPVPVNARYKSLELADLIRHSRMPALFISPPDPDSPGAPDFPALLAEAFPALAAQDRTALARPWCIPGSDGAGGIWSRSPRCAARSGCPPSRPSGCPWSTSRISRPGTCRAAGSCWRSAPQSGCGTGAAGWRMRSRSRASG